MSKSKKWEIGALRNNQSVCEAAKIILKTRLDHLLKISESYFIERSVESLHQVRIALRRVRYNMELFILCFDRKLFLRFYKRIESLQDISGSVRDLDVLKENLSSLFKEDTASVSQGKGSEQELTSVKSQISVRAVSPILIRTESKRIELEKNLELVLTKFLNSKLLKDFYKLLM